ncbi:MAG: sugar ABC transporter ATP-binding protein [bacterium]
MVLNNVSLRIEAGQIHALVGENGAGKSTLMKILIGVENADNGEIRIDGMVKHWRNPIDARRAGIAMVYQELCLVPSLSVFENIFLGRLLHNRLRFVNWHEMKNRVLAIFQDIDFHIDINKPIEELSIAERQMVEIARALTQNAELIILDEPTSPLSEQEAQRLFIRMKALSAKGVSFVFITHRLEEVFTVSNHITILRDGQRVKSCPIAEVDKHAIIHAMVGRELREQFPPRSLAEKSIFAQHPPFDSAQGEANFLHGEQSRTMNSQISGLFNKASRSISKVESCRPIVLKVENATRDKEFFNVSFLLRKGEILGFAGLVGAGRTELMEAIFGITKLDRGKIELYGKAVQINSPTEGVRAGLGLIADDRKMKGLVTEASVVFNMSMATQRKFATRGGWRLKASEEEAAKQLISKLKIKLTSIQQHIFRLSGGNQQKVAIGKTLNTDSSILIFDEPTRGIDIGAKREIYFLIRKLAEEGAAILLVSSELEELLGLSDRILVMHQGSIAGELSAEEATQEKIMQLAVGLCS